MNETELLELIEFIKSDTDLKAIFWNRVTYLNFVNENKETSLLIRDLSESRLIATNRALLEFRIISPEKSVWPINIKAYLIKIRNKFENINITIWNSIYYQIESLDDVFIVQNEKWQYEWITSFIFNK
jgi:hypothetical protein